MRNNLWGTTSFPPWLIMVVTSLGIVAFACGNPPPNKPSPTVPVSQPPSTTLTPFLPTPTSPTTIGIEYAILGVAETYANIGISYAKLQNVFVLWENIEPEPGQYQWRALDAIVLEYQQAGFTGLQMNLTASSPWASSQPPSLGNLGNTFPKEAYLDAYAAYVRAVVERYDHDGVEDMPALLYPINDYGIEREFTGYWPGTAEEYVRLLQIAYPAVKEANPNARVLLVALLMADIFDGNPSQTEINSRLEVEIDYMRKSVPEIRTILAACQLYDLVDFHALGNYTEIPLTTAWIRQELQTNGCGQKPIWIGDAFPLSLMIGFGGFVPPTPFAPVTLARRDEMVALLTSVADPTAADHATAQAWLYAETAIGLVRKIVVSAGEGLLGINIGNLEDWRTGVDALNKTAVPMLGASLFMGMTDTTLTSQKPGGDLPFTGKQWAFARNAGTPRPVYYALQELNRQIGNFSSVEKQNLGENIWAYQFTTPNGPVWVLWHDDQKLYLPGETAPMVNVQIPFPADRAVITHTPTEIGKITPETQTVAADNRLLSLQVNGIPLFVQIEK